MAFSDWTGIGGLADLFTVLNTNTDGVFGMGIWFAAYFVMWVVFTASSARGGSNEPSKDGFAGSSLVMSILSMPMAALTWIPPQLSIIPIVLSVIGIIILTRKND